MTGVKETNKNYVVDIDAFLGVDRMYQGSRYGQIVLIDKAKNPNIMQPWNEHYETELHMVVSQIVYDHIDLPNGFRWKNRGFICQ